MISTLVTAAPDRGTLQGTVTDPQGAFIPAAQVTVRNVDTGVQNTLKTNSVGFYLVTDLVPGNYTVSIQAAGFSAMEISGVTVTAGTIAIANAAMRVGESTQSVQVTAEAPLVENTSSNFTTSIDQRYIQDLPLNGRDIQTLVSLIPGVIQSAGPSGANFGFDSQFGGFPDPLHLVGSSISVNGSQAGANAWFLEGTLNATVGAEAAIVNPSPDAVSEFSLVGNGLAAEYGQTSGGVINVVLKSGTNAVHGDIYEYNRNSYFNATNPFARRDANGNPMLDPRVNWNDPGFSLGGPVVIPHVYNGKNRTFFFVSDDTSLLHETVNRLLTVPLPAERQGNFTGDPRYAAACNPAAGITNCIYDPFTTTLPDANGQQHRTPFLTPVIPASRINPLAQYFLNSIPNPNFLDPLQQGPGGCGNLCNNYMGAVGSSLTTYNASVKIDHRFNEKEAAFLTWLYNPSFYGNFRYPWNGPTAQTNTGVMGSQPYNTRNQLAIVGLTSTLTPTLVNEWRLSFGRQAMQAQPNPDSVTSTKEVQQKLAGMNFLLYDPLQSVPDICVDSFCWGPQEFQNGSMGQQEWTAVDNITKVLGKHTLKFGASWRRNGLWNLAAYGYNLGFNTGSTNDPVTGLGGNGLATFLLGWVDQGQPSSGVQYAPWQTNTDWGFYGQDDFRVTRNLTLSYGLRWDISGWISERHNALANFNASEMNPAAPGMMGALDYMGTPNHPGRNLYPANLGDFGPRFGFAYAPTSKTVIRGSFSIVYSNSMSALFGQGNGAESTPGFSVPVSATITDAYNTKPSFILGQPAPTLPIPNLATNAQTNNQLLGTYIDAFVKGSRDPYVENWNFSIQHELPGNMVVSAGYVGSHGLHLYGNELQNMDYVPTATQLSLRNNINLPFEGNPVLSQLYGCPTAANGNSLCPGYYALESYPQYYAVAALLMPQGFNRYNAGQLRVEKRYSHGLNFIASYTYSKNMVSPGLGALVANTPSPSTISNKGVGRIAVVPGAAGGASGDRYTHTGPENLDNVYGYTAEAPDDIPHVLNISSTYELPFGKGKAFATSRVASAIFGGWKISQNWNFQSGVPMFFNSGACNGISCRPNLVGNPAAGRGSETKQQQQNQWWNANAFTAPFGNDPTILQEVSTGLTPSGAPLDYNTVNQWWQYGNVGLRIPSGRTPAFWNVDASLSRDFHFTESRYITFRWDLFNALNHQNLGVPNNTWCLPPYANGATDATHIVGCQFGMITNVQTDPRAMQFALKFSF